jgi:3-phenylpropionate/cinnamic acid dioxygenase small subunit
MKGRTELTDDAVPAESDVVTWYACTRFLDYEAELLDENRTSEWLSLVERDIDYRIPIRTTRERSHGPGVSTEGFHMLEDYGSLATRVERLEGEYAWAEDPPSHTRRFVSNVRVAAGPDPGEFTVRSNLLVCRARGDATAYTLLAGERHDVLRSRSTGFGLRKRVVILDQTSLHTHNLALFL